MASEIIAYRFRGNRNYLSGATVLNHLCRIDSLPLNISLKMYRLTNRECVLSDSVLPGAVHVGSYRSDGCTWEIHESDNEIRSSYSCNEEAIIAQIQFNGNTARFMQPPVSGADYFEAIVAAYKQLLKLLKIDRGRKAIFAAIELRRVPVDGECRVVHRRELGDGFVESTLFVEGEKIGRMYYGWKSTEGAS